MSDKLVFKDAVESTLKNGLKKSIPSDRLASFDKELKEKVGIDMNQLVPAYRSEMFTSGVKLAQQILLRDKSSEESERWLGRRGA
jgi:hypothetical protein